MIGARAGLLEQLDADGYAVIDDTLPAPTVRALGVVAEELYRASPKRVGLDPLHLTRCVDRHERLLELVSWPATLDVVRAALSDNICVYHSHLDMHPPHSHRDYFWHQDIDTITRDCGRLQAPLCVKVGFFLSDVPTAEHGAMRVQPGTHRGRPFDPRDDGIPVTVRAGSAVVFDHRLWHSRGLNTSTVTRAAVFIAYAYRWIRRRDEIAGLPDPNGRLPETLRTLLTLLPQE